MFLLGDFTRKVLAQAVSQQKFWNHVFKFLDGISFSVYIWIPEKHLTYLQDSSYWKNEIFFLQNNLHDFMGQKNQIS